VPVLCSIRITIEKYKEGYNHREQDFKQTWWLNKKFEHRTTPFDALFDPRVFWRCRRIACQKDFGEKPGATVSFILA
jgi:hypothetical protein